MLASNYAQIVRDKAILRRLASFGTEQAAKVYDDRPSFSQEWTEEALAVAEYDLAEIASRLERRPEPGKAETLATVIWNLQHGSEDSIATGFAPLDRAFDGFNVGLLTILAARTSKGKTSLAMNIAINAAHAGVHVGYFSLEQPVEQMWREHARPFLPRYERLISS